MAGGLYSSLYGRIEQGIFDDLYRKHGSAQQVLPFESRLGQAEEEDEDEDEEEDAPSPAIVAAAPTGKPFFAREIAGFPLWLLGVVFLGFSYAYRRKAREAGSSA